MRRSRKPRTTALHWKTVVKEIQADELELVKQRDAIETELTRLQDKLSQARS